MTENANMVKPGQRAGLMKSTWWMTSLDTIPKKLMNFIQPHTIAQPAPRTGKIPVFTADQQLIWLAPRILPFILIQYLSHHIFEFTWHPILLLFLATVQFFFLSRTTVKLFVDLGVKWSFYDGSAPRDKIPDNKLSHLAVISGMVILVRNLIGIVLIYDRKNPVKINYYWPLIAFLYTCLLGK